MNPINPDYVCILRDLLFIRDLKPVSSHQRNFPWNNRPTSVFLPHIKFTELFPAGSSSHYSSVIKANKTLGGEINTEPCFSYFSQLRRMQEMIAQMQAQMKMKSDE